MLVVPTVHRLGTLYCTTACDRHAFSTSSARNTRPAVTDKLQSFLLLLSYTIFWMGDATVAGGGWGGGAMEEEDTGSGLGGAQATSGSGWGQAEPDQASLVLLDLQFAAVVCCSGCKVQTCPGVTAQS